MKAETLIVVVWNSSVGSQAGNVGDWLCARRPRIIVEYELPRSAGRVIVVEIGRMGSFHQRTHPEICVLNTDNLADGMQLARWIFEMYIEVPASPLIPSTLGALTWA